MASYCLVEDNVVIKGPISLPLSWRNISGLNTLSDQELKELGWLPVVMESIGSWQKYSAPVIYEDRVEFNVINKELSEVSGNTIQNIKNIRKELLDNLVPSHGVKSIYEKNNNAASLFLAGQGDTEITPGVTAASYITSLASEWGYAGDVSGFANWIIGEYSAGEILAQQIELKYAKYTVLAQIETDLEVLSGLPSLYSQEIQALIP